MEHCIFVLRGIHLFYRKITSTRRNSFTFESVSYMCTNVYQTNYLLMMSYRFIAILKDSLYNLLIYCTIDFSVNGLSTGG